ncbi:MAG TPA: aldo/keto reductase [Candidatus Methylacidiphilales bacterium]
MKLVSLAQTDLKVNRIAYGAMRISGSWDRTKVDDEAIKRGIRSLEEAVEAGYVFIDHADIYGDTTCETIQGLAFEKHPEWKGKLVIATKCGIRDLGNGPGLVHRYDFDGNYIRESVDASLKRLKIDRIDLFQLHRPDWLADPADIAAAMVDLHKAGKVRYFGVSNFRPSLVSALQSALPFPLVSNQVEIHLLRLACFEDGTLDQCLEKKMAPLAWSPLAGGRLAPALMTAGQAAAVPPSSDPVVFAACQRLRPVLADIANAHNATPLAVLLAWLMRHPSGIIPILGTVRGDAIREAAKADAIDLDRVSWYRILNAARGEKLA